MVSLHLLLSRVDSRDAARTMRVRGDSSRQDQGRVVAASPDPWCCFPCPVPGSGHPLARPWFLLCGLPLCSSQPADSKDTVRTVSRRAGGGPLGCDVGHSAHCIYLSQCVLYSAIMARRWLDYQGQVFERPDDTPLTTWGYFDQLTHRLWPDGTGELTQAYTGCGRRGCPASRHEIPGRGPVDCPECLEEGTDVQATE